MERSNPGRALGLLGKAVEMRRNAGSGPLPPTWSRALGEVHSSLLACASNGGLSLLVGDGGLYVGSELVLEDSDPDKSLPAILRRDGISELDFLPGLTQPEVATFVDAVAIGADFRGFGDDAYTRLWRAELPHLSMRRTGQGDPSIAAEVSATIEEMFGGSPVVLDEMPEVPGRAPARTRAELLAEVEGEGAPSKLALAGQAACRALASSLPPADVDEIFRGAIELLDAMLQNKDLVHAAELIGAARNARAASERVDLFLEEALSQDRTRQVLAIHKNLQTAETFTALVDFFRGLGTRAVALIFHLLPSLVEADQRRQLSDIALEIGGLDLEKVRTLIGSDLAFVVQEGLYFLSRMGTPEADQLMTSLEQSPRVEVRGALADIIDRLEGERALQLGEKLIRDQDVNVRIRSAQALARTNDKHAAKIIENVVHGPTFDAAPLEQKRAFFEAFAISSQVRALLSLSKHMKKADGLLVKKDVEDLGVAAVEAMRHIPTARTVEFLKEGAVMKNKRVRDAAREVLQRFKERSS